MKYKNISRVNRTVYGVEFRPGEVHDVPGVIHHPKFIPVPDEAENVKASVKSTQKQPKPVKVEDKVEVESKPTTKTNKQEVTPNGSDSNQ